MPFIKISGLTTATAVSATNQFEINQNGGSRSATVAQVAAFARTSATDPVVLPAGTVSAPALTFTGDTNTGIYSPAADTIAFTEGGVEAMRIDASGNVGIGTNAPGTKLDIYDPASAGNPAVRIRDNISDLRLYPSSGGSYVATISNTPLIFNTNNTERMRLTASGLLGLGTSSPITKMTIADAGEAGTRYLGNGLTSSGLFVGYNSAAYVYNDSNTPMIFGTNAAERMRIDASGNVGIGTTAPTSRLTVQGTGSSVEVYQSVGSIRFSSSPSRTNNWYLGANISDSVNGGFIVGSGADISSGTARMVIDSAGNIRVGDASAAGTSGRFIDIYNLGADANSYAIMRLITQEVATSNASTVDIIKYKNGNFALSNNDTNAATCTTFGVAGSERMRITAAGNVGIGTSLPTFRLVAANSSTDGGWLYSSGAVSILGLGGYGSATDGAFSLRYDRAAGAVAFNGGSRDTPVERMRIDNVGNVGIGTSSPGGTRLRVASSDTSFNDTIFAINSATGAGAWGRIGFQAGTNYGFVGVDNSGVGYLYNTSNNAFTFGTNNTERMRINASGSVGIGNSDPQTRLDVGSATGLNVIRVGGGNSGASDGGALYCAQNGVTNVAFGNVSAILGSGYSPDALLYSANAVRFFSGATESMRITNASRFQFRTTAFDYGVFNISGYTDGGLFGIVMRPTANNSTPFRFENAAGSEVGLISCTTTNTSYVTSSDYRLKENVVPLTGAAARVQALKPSRFNFIADPDRTMDGFLAHEAAEVVPEAVTGEKDAVNEDGSIKAQGIDHSKLVPLLTAALQEALAEITSLKARVAILENK